MILGDLSRTPQAVCECHDSFTLASLEDTHRRWLSIPRSQPTKYPGPKLPHSKTAGWGLERRASHDGWPFFMPQTQDFEPTASPLQSPFALLAGGLDSIFQSKLDFILQETTRGPARNLVSNSSIAVDEDAGRKSFYIVLIGNALVAQ
jgi:hypothetical protein